MSLLNLTIAELFTVLIPLSGILVALYFYDRSRRELVVSTLRFWPRRTTYPMTTRRKKLRQPWSLLLQLLAALLLLLAIADFRFLTGDAPPRRHVVILETSAAMGARNRDAVNDGLAAGMLMDVARRRTIAYLRAIPAADPVMLIRCDANPALAVGFTTDREKLRHAIEQSTAGWTAPHLAGALELARSALELAGEDGSAAESERRPAGEVAYIGAARLLETEAGRVHTERIPHLRWIVVGEQSGDAGIRSLSALREASEAERWQIVAEVENHGAVSRAVRVRFSFNGRDLGYKALEVKAETAEEITFRLRTKRRGTLRATLEGEDDFEGNNRAQVELPDFQTHSALVYSSRPERFGSILTALPGVEPVFERPGAYSARAPAADLVLFDGAVPGAVPGAVAGTAAGAAAIYLNPPAASTPVKILRSVSSARITRWSATHPIGRGLRSRDIVVDRASVFELGPGDEAIAETAAGPVIVAFSQGGRRGVVFGFDLFQEGLEQHLAVPLIFANTVRWFLPPVLLGRELRAGAPGVVETAAAAESEQEIEISSAENPYLPWSLEDGKLRFFVARPGVVTLRTPHRETRFSLTLPQTGSHRWEPPARTLRGVPPPVRASQSGGPPWWPWLALAALICWAADWRYYGRGETASSESVPATGEPPARAGGASIFGGWNASSEPAPRKEALR